MDTKILAASMVCDEGLLKCLIVKIFNILETAILLLIYSLAMVVVIYRVGRSLERSAYVTILSFFVAELVSLILYIVNAMG